MIAHPGEFYDGENEGDDRRNRQEYKRRVNVSDQQQSGRTGDGTTEGQITEGGSKRIRMDDGGQGPKDDELEDQDK